MPLKVRQLENLDIPSRKLWFEKKHLFDGSPGIKEL